jgi:hypothetical protein
MAKRLVVLCVAIGLLVVAPVRAHHTGATLLSDKIVTIKGVVQSWLWSNPHCLLSVDVKGDNGEVVRWVLELQAPNTIFPDGYRKNSFKPGDEVTVALNPVANGGPYGRIAQVVLADGKTFGNLPGAGRGRGAAAQ